MERLEQMENTLLKCEKELEEIKSFYKKFKNIEKHRKILEEYYKKQYLSDYEKYRNADKNYKILNQDSIWNVLESQYNEKVRLLKKITKTL